MAPDPKRLVVFVHGYSVRSTDTYGQLPARLISEAKADAGLELDVRHVWLGRYISFHDAVRLEDLSTAFEAALQRELKAELAAGRRFVCITHSTGGPLVRDWWHRFWLEGRQKGDCPMSHLIQLAPANFGSALAQLGKGRLSRISTWFQGVEPGTGVLDWLELGSPESWRLNEAWVRQSPKIQKAGKTFCFVLTGQSIDHKLYDHVNSYTGEIGSDGVVRVAAANLAAGYLRVEQDPPRWDQKKKAWVAPTLKVVEKLDAAPTALAILPGLAHSGKDMGILRSVKDNSRPHATVTAILECLKVSDRAGYEAVRKRFVELSEQTQADERLEVNERFFLPDVVRIHDRKTQVIVRVTDESGAALADFDLLVTGEGGDPNRLPQGFLGDRQRNRRHVGTVTFFLNHDLLVGTPELKRKNDVVRRAQAGISELGMRIDPRPTEGFMRYLPCELGATGEVLKAAIQPNRTTMIDVVLRRVVGQNTFTLTRDLAAKDFTKTDPGDPVV